MSNIRAEVERTLQLPRATLSVLLHHFSWEKTALLDAILEDEKGIFRQVGLSDCLPNTKPNDDVLVACQICYSDIYQDKEAGSVCGHSFCRTCWLQYLTIQITIHTRSIGLQCPMTNCKSLVEEQFIWQILSKDESHVLARYKSLICTSYIQKNINLR